MHDSENQQYSRVITPGTNTTNYTMHVIHFRVHAPLLAVGSDDPNTNAGGKVQIHGYNEASRFVHFFIKKTCGDYFDV